MKQGIFRKLTAMAVGAAAVMSLVACGGKENVTTPQSEWLYVPEFKSIEDENADYYDMQLAGDSLYYVSYNWDEESGSSQSLNKYSLTDGSTASVSLAWTDSEADNNLNNFCVGSDGSLYGVSYSYSISDTGEYESKEALCKFDASGKQIYTVDMSKQLAENPENSYINGLSVDALGRVYVTGQNIIWLFDGDGSYKGNVSLGSSMGGWINAMGCGKDGKFYVCAYNYDDNGSGYELMEIDFDNKTTGATYHNFPTTNSEKLMPGIEKDFLVHDGTTLYEYDMATQSKVAVCDWLDCDINGTAVRMAAAMPDGRVLAVIEDWETDDRGLALLTKTKASEVAVKETIVFASMGNSDIQAAAVAFNKSNDKYRIKIKNYVDYDNWSDTTWKDALTNLNNDITSSNCPDIIDLSGLNISQLAAKGVLEDLGKYLDSSSVLKREDFLENILKACTYGDVLVSIPASFEMQTIIGSAEKLGNKNGWTMDEMMDFAKKYPEAELFDRMSKSTIMYYLMMFNENQFVNWETGECKFDTDAFKNVLKFANEYPDEIMWEEGQPSTPTRIQNGEVLLDTAYIYEFDSIQIYWEMFKGDITCIGYPSVDGSCGSALYMSQPYAITSKSKHKEGAWAFIESYLTKEDEGNYWYGFPTLKSKLNNMMEEAMKVEYVTDENGEPYLDENGEPIIMGGGSGIGYEDGWEYTYTIPTQKEVDIILGLMEVARPISNNGESPIMDMINEEAAAYWEGQKSVDEVAAIIQSRVKIYVDENR